jgi:hypothetical protein
MHWIDRLFQNFGLLKLKPISPKMKSSLLKKWDLFWIDSSRSFLEAYLEGGGKSILINRLVDEMLWPTSHNAKVVRHIVPFKLSNLHYNWSKAGWLLEAIVNPPLEVPPPRYGWIYKILFDQNPNKKQYEATIGNFLGCTSLDFVAMTSNLLGWWGKWVPYKHMYYVSQHVMFCG